jgi:hypothetical protein
MVRQIQDKDGSGFSMQLSASQGIGTYKEPLNHSFQASQEPKIVVIDARLSFLASHLLLI